MISEFDPNPVLVEIILSACKNYPKLYIYYHVGYNIHFWAVSILPYEAKAFLGLFCLYLNMIGSISKPKP